MAKDYRARGHLFVAFRGPKGAYVLPRIDMPPHNVTGITRAFMILAMIVLVVAALALAQKILMPFVLAILLTFVLMPFVSALQKRGLWRAPAAFLVVTFALLFLATIGWAVSGQFHALAAELPQHKDTIRDKIATLPGMGDSILDNLLRMFQEIREDVRQEKESTTGQPPAVEPMPVTFVSETPGILNAFSMFMGPLVEGVVTAAFIVVMVSFMLIMREDLRGRILRLIGHGRITHTTKALDDGAHRISRFLLMQMAVNVGFGAIVTLGLHVIGLPYAILWGFLAGILRFIPYLGTWVAILLPLIHSFAVFPGWFQPLATVLFMGGLDLFAAYVVEPLVFGHSTGVSPFALLLAAAFWTWLWGPIGLLLSTPLTSCLVVLGKHVSQLEFLDVLLGDDKMLAANVELYQRLLARDLDEATDLVEEYVEEHTLEETLEDLLLPALVFARTDLERGEIAAEERHFIEQSVRDLIDDLPAPEVSGTSQGPQVVVFGCPVSDGLDELSLRLLGKMLEGSRCDFRVLSANMLSAEVVARVREQPEALICLASLPPNGIARTRYLCKRLRADIPGVKLLVCRWGAGEHVARVREKLLSAGADHITLSLRETRTQILSLLPVLSAQQRQTANAAKENGALATLKG